MKKLGAISFAVLVLGLLSIPGPSSARAAGPSPEGGASVLGTEAADHCGSTMPCGRCCMGMAFDRDHGTGGNGQLILFGGTDNSGRTLADTWTYDLTDGTWTWRDVPNGPCPRHSTRMAYDEIRQEAILFGGDGACRSPQMTLGDTWAWTGDTWSPRCIGCTVAPTARQSFGFAWDDADGYILLFGGNGCGGYCGDTWAWNGTTWTELCSACSFRGSGATEPTPRRNASMIFSGVRNGGAGEVILAAGEDPRGLIGGTWRWAPMDGIDGEWHRVEKVASPSPRTTQRMAYDESTDLIMLFGGCTDSCNTYGRAVLTDAQYRLGTGKWSRDGMTRPTPRCCVGLVYASRSPFPALGYGPGIFLIGGGDQTHNGLGDFYFYDGNAWCLVAYSGGSCSEM